MRRGIVCMPTLPWEIFCTFFIQGFGESIIRVIVCRVPEGFPQPGACLFHLDMRVVVGFEQVAFLQARQMQTAQTQALWKDFSRRAVTLVERSTAGNAMLPRLLRSRALPRIGNVNGRSLVSRRTLIAAPKPGQGPLMERRADRELPGT